MGGNPTSARPARARRLGRPASVDSAETLDRLLKAGRRTFAERGYATASNKEIAAAAGITAAAIYHYYPSKADLYAAVYGDVQSQIGEAFEKAVAEVASFSERLCAILDVAVELAAQETAITAMAVGVVSEVQRHPELGPLVADAQHATSRLFARLVNDALEAGELAGSYSAAAIGDMVTVVFGGLARFNRSNNDPARHREVTEVLKALLRAQLLVDK
jgi:TetR/AcrR family transcriptional regulator, cholesterol catabolism regulator